MEHCAVGEANKSIASIDQISAVWLSSLLEPRFPETIVTSVHLGRVITGTATKVRLLLEYNQAGREHGLPPTLWLKAGLEAHGDSERMRAIYAGEALFYRDIAPELDLGLPRGFAASFDDSTGQSYILLEDLLARHVRFGHSSMVIVPDEAARVLELQAQLHARYWGSDALTPFDWLGNGGAMGRSGVHDFTYSPEIWDRCRGLPRGRLMTGPMGDREGMHKLMSKLLKFDIDHANCLVHGDAQLMNMYFTPDGVPGYLDWQTAMHGFWAHDVTEFIVTALSVEDRRRSERDLVDAYVTALKAQGVTGLSSAAAWSEYTRHTAYTFHWVLCQPEWQPEDVCLLNAERACAAIQDHSSLNAW
jgi:Phosphotransferase enzyme family